MKTQINIVVGRFQPLTYGHLKCVEEAYKKLHLSTVLVMIDTPDDKVDSRHPFPSSMLIPIYKEIIKSNKHILDIITVKSANIVDISEKLNNLGYVIAGWTCGTDREDAYRKMCEKYNDVLTDDFRLLVVKRSDEDISATAARKALVDNDVRLFNKLTPVHSLRSRMQNNYMFEILRKQILNIFK